MYWITENLGTASLPEIDMIKKLENVKVELVTDLIDGKQVKKGQLKSKVKHIEQIIKKGKKVVIICVGGMSFDKAHNLIREKVPIARINMDLIDFVKEEYVS